MSYLPHTDSDLAQMLKTIGVERLDDLLEAIPTSLRQAPAQRPAGLSELELTRHLRTLARMNCPASELAVYRGAGLYEHAIPAAVEALASRGEFATAYTPYQPEASQGTLQAIYEFQTMICELTGMEVANASLYDGASGLAEAALMALRVTERRQLVMSQTVHPEYRQVLTTYVSGLSVSQTTLPAPTGVTDVAQARTAVTSDTAALIVQMPNFFGCLEPVHELAHAAHAVGALCIVCIAEPVSLGLLVAPGHYGADIVVGEAQSLGSPMSYGGPSLGFFATRQAWLRKLPGRIAGRTTDQQGRCGYVLTLQAREQHIRREKATSNICTNEGLLALRTTIFLSLLGPQGLQELAALNCQRAHALQEALCRLPCFAPAFPQPFFNEFVLQLTQPSLQPAIEQALAEAGVVGGLPLDVFDASWRGRSLWCVTETKAEEQVDRVVEVVHRVCA